MTVSRFSCHKMGVLDLMKASGALLEKVCLLDPKIPKAEKVLSPEDGDGRFQWFFLVCILFVPAWTVAFPTLGKNSLYIVGYHR